MAYSIVTKQTRPRADRVSIFVSKHWRPQF